MTKSDKPKTSLRKSPKQARSRELVDSVMEAATRILEAAGVESVTTNKVAEMAGVSIGSLYQYFPGKDAIFSRLIENRMEVNAKRIQKLIDAKTDSQPAQVVAEIVSEVVDLFVEQRVIVATLFAEVPKLKKTRDVIYRRNRMITMFIRYLSANPKSLRQPDKVEEQVYVLSHAVIGLLQVAILENFESYPPEVLKTNLQRMAVFFLFD